MVHPATLANGPPGESRIDALNTATSNMADKPTLADGPPTNMKLLVMDNQLAHDLLEIYVFNKSPFETAQVYSSSVPVRLSIGASLCLVRMHVKVLKFTGQGYSSSLLVSFTPHLKLSLRADQILADLCVQ